MHMTKNLTKNLDCLSDCAPAIFYMDGSYLAAVDLKPQALGGGPHDQPSDFHLPERIQGLPRRP
jgi:hypothetical protein